jgi:hypothetical protein
MSNRKSGQVLNCKYGYQWPLGNHESGYVKVICPIQGLYIWSETRLALA